jgi:hypothetical protein
MEALHKSTTIADDGKWRGKTVKTMAVQMAGMGYEKFEEAGSERGRPPATDPMVSLRKSGSIGINRPALETYFEDDEGAIMYYDGDDAQVGIEPVGDSEADDAAYSVTKTDSGGTIVPKAFLEEYDLVPTVTTQFEPEHDEDNGLVTVDLDDPIGTHGSPYDEDES